jgi:acyl carrier protein
MEMAEIRKAIIEMINEKLVIFNIAKAEVNDDFDLVKSGLLDSMSFIDMVAGLEDMFSVEVDFDVASEKDDFTTVGGLTKLIKETKDAG